MLSMVNTRELATKYRLAHWAQVMQERNVSGMSIKEYCKTSGLRENVYFYWQRKLRETACQELLTVDVASPVDISTDADRSAVPNGWAMCNPVKPAKPSESTGTGNILSIEIGSGRISIGTDVDAGLLTKVCRVLMAL